MSGKLLYERPGVNLVDWAWQSRGGNLLAVSTPDHVRILDRSNRMVHEQSVKRAQIAWDSDGQILAMIGQKALSLAVLYFAGKRQKTLDFEIKDVLTAMAWSPQSPILALGTQKGSLILVDFKSDQKLPVLGKHSKKISVCTWSDDNLLAIGSIDGRISISNANGDEISNQRLRSEPEELAFGSMKGETRSHSSDTVSCLLDQKSIFLWKYSTEDAPSELTFQSKYGRIVSYAWYGDGYIAISFQSGRVIGVSTHMAEIGTEIFNIQDHSEFCSMMKLSKDLSKLATAGDNSIRIHSTSNLKVVDSTIEIKDETAGGFGKIAWSDNGALVAALSNVGTLYVYLTELTVLGQSSGNRLGYLSSLSEVTIFECGVNQSKTISLTMEPNFVGLGPYHFAAGMNNKAVFYLLDEESSQITQEYMSTVKKVSIGDNYAVALLSDGRLFLHIIEGNSALEATDRETKILPEQNEPEGAIVSADIKGEMLIYCTAGGKIRYFLLDEWAEVNCFEHSAGIKHSFPDQAGTRLLIVDEHSRGYVYSAVDDSLLEIHNLPPSISGCLWDADDGHVFAIWDVHNKIYTFAIHDQHVDGVKIEFVASGMKPKRQAPLMLAGGVLYLQTNSGILNKIILPSHRFLKKGPITMEDLHHCLNLRKWPSVHRICNEIDHDQAWDTAAQGALKCLEIEAAIRYYQKVRNSGMVLSLLELVKQEDAAYLQGSCAMLLRRFEQAQAAFLSSSDPLAALDMRKDLHHWEEALQLAARLAPKRVPEIAREYAGQQEFEGNYSGALSNFERAIQDGAHILSRDELTLASAGVARCSIRMGDLRRGVQLANQHPNRMLKKDCGEILEKMKQYSAAGKLFVKGEFWEKAAAAFIKGKEWNNVGEIIDRVDTVKIHQAYAKAREHEGNVDEALAGYFRAGDHEARIRLLLAKNRPAEAEEIAKETGSTDGANLVARYYIKKGDFGSGIEFLVLSGCNNEAFQLAQQHGQMETYADIIRDKGKSQDYYSIAVHFENENNWLKAGKFFLASDCYDRALRHFLQCHVDDEGENIRLAIECVGRARDDSLSRILLDYLLGHHEDGAAKHATFLFQFYVSLEQYTEAASTAVIIARDQQVKGEYKRARKFLFEMYKDLRQRQIRIPAEMSSSLLLLHSYLLVKPTISLRSDHVTAAHLLCRVAKSISKFPSHIVQLLTKTVIECQKVGMKKSAFEYSALLMRPEYRDEVDQKYRRAIEKLVRERRGADQEDLPPEQTPCPFCEKEFDSYELTCPHCKSTSPFCVASGRHVHRSSLTKCPRCDSSALLEPFLELLSREECCPLCQNPVSPSELSIVANPLQYLSTA